MIIYFNLTYTTNLNLRFIPILIERYLSNIIIIYIIFFYSIRDLLDIIGGIYF